MKGLWTLVASSGADLPSESSVLSLHPAVSYELGRQNKPYKIPEDYYREKWLRAGEDTFFDAQLLWFDRLDDLIRDGLGGEPAAVGLGQIHHNRIKYLVDSVILRTRMIEAFLRAEKPRKILWVEAPWEASSEISIYDFDHPQRFSQRPLLEHAALMYGFELEVRAPAILKNKHSVRSPQKSALKEAFVELGLKTVFEKIRYRTWQGVSGIGNKPVYFFLDAGTWAVDSLIRQALGRGRVLLKQDEWIREPGKKNPVPVGAAVQSGSPELFENLFERFNGGFLMRWIEDYAPAARAVVTPYFRHFFTKVVPEVFRETQTMEALMRREKVTAVIARASAGSNYASVLLAAKRLGVPRVCFQHSIGPLDMKDWVWDELAFFDLNFAMHPVSRDYFRAQQPKLGPDCRVQSASHALRRLAGRRVSRRRKSRERVFYVPAKLARGAAHFNTPSYPMTWYFEHQKKLLEYFSKRHEFDFVYKHSRYQGWAAESVLPWLAQQRFKNITVVEGPFPEFLAEIDRVIFDYPSSGTFESAASQVPMLALAHESMRVWPPMRQLFGISMVDFEDSDEAIQKIEQFLEGPPEWFKVSVPWEPEENPFRWIDSMSGCAKTEAPARSPENV